jgi:sugar lactone lactonase YvrE
MISRKLIVLVSVFTLFIFASLPVAAQDEPVASGLNSPRQVSYDSEGNLYIAEAGSGGEETGTGAFGEVKFGPTSQITVVTAEGEQSVILPELISTDTGFGNINGAADVFVTDDSYWVVLGEGPEEVPEGSNVSAVVQIDRETMEIGDVIDVGAYEVAENPDGSPETVSNPVDLDVAEDGTLYIVDASGNTVLTWTAEDGLATFAVWPPDETGQEPSAVPTAVDIGPEGDVYVGFLSGFPFPTGGARIERWSAEGELVETFEGLTLVTDVVVTEDGTVYAVEMAEGFGDEGYIPDSGRVVTVSAEGVEAVAEGLPFPYGLAQTPDGGWVVSTYAAFSAPGSGEVIAIAPEM